MITIKECNTISVGDVPELDSAYIDENCRYICAFENKCVGILVYEVKEEILYIRYLFVKEEMRRQGIGGELFQRIQEIAKEEAPDGMIFSGVIPEKQQFSIIRFFIKRGFMVPEFGDQIASISVKDWRESYLASIPVQDDEIEEHVCSMTELSNELDYDYRNNIRPNVLPCCRIEDVKGVLIPELSLAYDYQGKIGSYILMSDIEGILYLDSVYIYGKNGVFFVPLLRHCFIKQEEQGWPYETMKVTMFSDESRVLFRRLTKGMKVEIENQITMYRM